MHCSKDLSLTVNLLCKKKKKYLKRQYLSYLCSKREKKTHLKLIDYTEEF